MIKKEHSTEDEVTIKKDPDAISVCAEEKPSGDSSIQTTFNITQPVGVEHCDIAPETRLSRISKLLEIQFGTAFEHNVEKNCGFVRIGKNEAVIDYKDFSVSCKSGVLKGRIEGILSRSLDLVSPLSQE